MPNSLSRMTLLRVGACIYCGMEARSLGDEHIVPYSLGGPWVLEAASCRECAKVTGRNELYVSRNMLGQMRAIFDLPTRRRKERPIALPIEVLQNGLYVTKMVPLSEHVPSFSLPIFPPPGILWGPPEDAPELEVLAFLNYEGRQHNAATLTAKYGHWRVNAEVHPTPWGRLLAKAAYGLAVGFWGLEAVKGSPLIDIALGKRHDIGRWVGCFHGGPIGNVLGEATGLHAAAGGLQKRLRTVNLRLFAQFGMPEYVVVVEEESDLDPELYPDDALVSWRR